MKTYLEQAREVRAHLIERGGDPRTVIAPHSSAEEDEAQAAALDNIDAIIEFLDSLAETGKDA